MSRVLDTNDWETLDSLWAVGWPTPGIDRHIFVMEAGFRLRVKTGPFGGSGNNTPLCVNYGGWAAVTTQTVQVKGPKGSIVRYLQGSGSC